MSEQCKKKADAILPVLRQLNSIIKREDLFFDIEVNKGSPADSKLCFIEKESLKNGECRGFSIKISELNSMPDGNTGTAV